MKSRSSKRTLASIVLGFESFAAFFATLAAFGLRVADVEVVWAIGLTVSILMILTPGLLRYEWGYLVGWALQIAMLISGFWLWGMFFVGAILTGLILPAIAVFVIERDFAKAAAFAAAGAVLTFFGFMHGEAVGFAVTPGIALAYAVVAAALFAYARTAQQEAPPVRAMPTHAAAD